MKSSKLFPILAMVALLLAGVYGISSALAAPMPPDPLHQDTTSDAPSATDAEAIARDYISRMRGEWNLTAGDVADLVVTDNYATRHNGVHHVWFQQRLDGIGVHSALIGVHILPDGTVFHATTRAVPTLRDAANARAPRLTAIQGAEAAAAALDLAISEPLEELRALNGADSEVLLSDGGISQNLIPAKLVYEPLEDGTVRLAWNVVIYELSGDHWWDARVDALTGELLAAADWVVSEQMQPIDGLLSSGDGHFTDAEGTIYRDNAPHLTEGRAAAGGCTDGSSYRVYELPKEHPNDGPRTLVNEPADCIASPYGWHDTDGTDGAEYTITRGNNVHAFQDPNNTNTSSGDEPDGGAGLDFDFPIDLGQEPVTYVDAATVNLFYWNNIHHDLSYHYGFDEASGNFQVNNYGRGGLGSDNVEANAQDGRNVGNRNNANFATPADGANPRMQMYLWNLTSPERDGDLDSGIILHEYGHGISNRLTGGPSQVSCLNNNEQMGEGWSDWQSLVFTAVVTDTGPMARGIGTYALGEPPTGPGIRPTPYSTDFAVNPTTYSDIAGLAIPHGVGYAWATMLWEMYWELVGEYGFDANLYTGTGGNNLAHQLVMDGMKLQPCSPGFVDGRDAILAADLANTGGVNACLIWEAFARRGLGFSADQGSTNSTTDGTEAFDMPPECLTPDFGLVIPEAEQAVCAPDDATVDIVVQSFAGFVDPVTLSVDSGQPAGTTATFNPNPVTPPDTSVLTISQTGSAAPGNYPMTVLGTAPTSTHTATLSLDIFDMVPGAVTLVAPGDGEMNVALPQILFDWQTATQGNTYWLQVDDNSDFSSPLVDESNIVGNTYIIEDAIAIGFDYGTTYYWRVRSTNTCGDGAWSTPFSFTTEAAPGSCQPGQTVVTEYATDFEDGGTDWLVDVFPPGEQTWAISSARTNSGTNAFYAEDPDPGQANSGRIQYLISPAVALPTGQSPVTLQFFNWQEFEPPNADGRCWDGGILEITIDGGATWNQVPDVELLTDPYDAIIWDDSPGNNPLGPVPAWCPNPAQPWLNSIVDLGAYEGETVQFRWALGSDSFAGAEGWYVDDVRVQSCAGTPTAVTLGGLDSGSSPLNLPLAAVALVGLVGLAMVWRHKREA